MAPCALRFEGDVLMRNILIVLGALAAGLCGMHAAAQSTSAPTPAPLSNQSSDTAIQHSILIDMKPGVDVLALDRWYITYHAPETLARTGRAQTRYVSFRTYQVSDAEALRFNMVRGRVTEIGFDSVATFRAGVTPEVLARHQATPPGPGLLNGFTSETLTLRTTPEAIFKAGPSADAMAAKPVPYARWLVFVSFPANVPAAQGEDWLKTRMGPALAASPDVRKAVLFRPAIARNHNFMLELWFDDPNSWRRALGTLAADERLQPGWGGVFPYVSIRSALVGDLPDLDFRSDRRVIP